jgi:hypothetical protein
MFPLLTRIRSRLGYNQHSPKTIDRLLYSKHVADLRWIAFVCTLSALLLVLLLIFIILPIFIYDVFRVGDFKYAELYKIVLPFGVAIGAALGGIIAWCYKTGSSRLGMVDLFACEITTLCRICVINDLAKGCIEAFRMDVGEVPEGKEQAYYPTLKDARARFSCFESAEAYTPIFDANAKDLQSLDVKVLINLTEFYTYWKSMRDAFRKLAAIEHEKEEFVSEEKTHVWPRTMRNVIYMLFLACESARKAVRDLIEFQPNNAQNTITILLCELPCWRFLIDSFPRTDVRHKRLLLRRPRYQDVIPKFIDRVRSDLETTAKAESADRSPDQDEVYRDWKKSEEMLDDLVKAFADAMADPPKEQTATA